MRYVALLSFSILFGIKGFSQVDVYATQHLFNGIEVFVDDDDTTQQYHIYRSEAQDFATATKIGSAHTSIIARLDNQVRADRPYYYWLVNHNDTEAANPIGPAAGQRSIEYIDFSDWEAIDQRLLADGTPWPDDANLGKPVYGNGRWMVMDLANTRYFYSDDDGLTWTMVDTPTLIGNAFPTTTRERFTDFAHGNGVWLVRTTRSTLAYSEDGLTWNWAQNNIKHILFANGQFVVTKDNGSNVDSSMTSTDGISWTNGTNLFESINSSTNTQSGYLQFGNGYYVYSADGHGWYSRSSDGLNWERIDTVPSNEDWKISFANGQFVRVKGTYYNGGNYNIYEYRLSTSSDGANWSTTIHDWLALGYHTANTSDRVYASGNRFFLRTGKETYVSTNALNWSLLSRDNYIYQGVGNGGTHIATNGQHLARSPDGSTYTGISSLVGRHFSDLAISGSTAVATGYGGLMATSTDQGQSWQLIEGLFPDPVGNSVTDYDLVGLEVVNGQFVAFASRRSLMGREILKLTSSDGINWSQAVSYVNSDDYQQSISIIAPGALHVVNDKYFISDSNQFWYSANGIGWQKSTLSNASQYAYGGSFSFFNGTYFRWNYFSFLGVTPDHHTTTDPAADTWAPNTTLPEGMVHNIGFAQVMDDYLYVVDYTPNDYDPVVFRSADGTTWEESPLFAPGELPDRKLGDLYANGVSLTSLDGLHFSKHLPPSGVTLSDVQSDFAVGIKRNTFFRAALPVVVPAAIESIETEVSILYQTSGELSVTATGDPVLEFYWYKGVAGDTSNPVGTGLSSLPIGPVTEDATYWVRVANEFGSADSETINVSVTYPIPELLTTTLSIEVGKPINLYLEATYDQDTWTADALPDGLNLDPDTGRLYGFLQSTGETVINLTILNGEFEGSGTLTLTGLPPAPVFVSPQTVSSVTGESFEFQIQATGDPTSFSATSLPLGLSINETTGRITGIPQKSGEYTVVITATNGTGSTVQSIVLNILPSPNAARINSPLDVAVTSGSPFNYLINSTLPTATFEASNLPDWMEFDAPNGRLFGTPSTSGEYFVSISTLDEFGEGETAFLRITVEPDPDAPVITSSNAVIHRAGSPFSLQLDSTPAADTYILLEEQDHALFSLDASTLSWQNPAPGTYNISLQGSNSSGTSRRFEFELTVLPPLDAPVMTDDSIQAATRGSETSWLIGTSVPASHFELLGQLPDGLSLDSQIGLISGTPLFEGIYSFSIRAAINSSSIPGDFKQFTLAVEPPADLPRMDLIEPRLLYAGTTVLIQLSADPEATDFSVSNLPSGLFYDSETKTVYGTPNRIGKFTTRFIPQLDGDNGLGADFTFEVRSPLNGPKIIGSSDLTATVGKNYTYVPMIQVEPGDAFLYASASGLPRGLTLDTKTAQIEGTPLETGTFEISITPFSEYGEGQPLLLTLVVNAGASVPVIQESPVMYLTSGELFEQQIQASNGPHTVYAATNLPKGLNINRLTGVISGRAIIPGEFTSTLSVSNSAGTSPPLDITFVIEAGLLAPRLPETLYMSGAIGEEIAFQLRASGLPEHGIDNPLPPGSYYSANNLPSGLSLDPQTGLISGFISQIDQQVFQVYATSEVGTGTASTVYLWGYYYADYFRILGPAIVRASVGESVPVNAQTINSTGATYWMYPNWYFTVSPDRNSTGQFTLTPLRSGSSQQALRGSVYKGTYYYYSWSRGGFRWYEYNQRSTKVFHLIVPPEEGSPVMTTPLVVSGQVGEPFELQLTATNEPQSFSFEANSWLPNGIWLDYANRKLTGTPRTPGDYDVFLIARNAVGTSLPRPVTLRIFPQDDTLGITALNLNLDGHAIQANATDIDLEAQSSIELFGEVGQIFDANVHSSMDFDRIIAQDLPEGIYLNQQTGQITGIPTRPGVHAFTLQPANGDVFGKVLNVTMQVGSRPGSPTIQADQSFTATAGQPITGTIQATDATTYYIENSPDGMGFDFATGTLTGSVFEPGTYELTLRAANDSGDAFPRTATLTILPAGNTPVITAVEPLSVQAGDPVSIQLDASPEASAWLAVDLPDGLGVDSESGLISGSIQTPGEFSLVVRASNASGMGGDSSIALTVTGATGTPTITSNPTAFISLADRTSVNLQTSNPADFFNLPELPDGFQFDPVTGSLTHDSAQRGLYSFRLNAVNTSGEGTYFNLLVRVNDAFDDWALSYFPESSFFIGEGALEWDPMANPDEDALPNLAEFVFGYNPTVNEPDADWPTPILDSTNLLWTFPLERDPSDSLVFEASIDPSFESPMELSYVVFKNPDNSFLFQLAQPLTSELFYRIRLVRPKPINSSDPAN
jgi:hypothetical protein